MSSDKDFWDQMNQQFAHMIDFANEANDFESTINELQKVTQALAEQSPKPKEELIREYQNYIDHMLIQADKYENMYEQLEEQLIQNSVQVEYASGGECIHRGFLCPSPILDKVVGGCNRGQLIKKPRVNTKNYYVYHFNDESKLIGVERYVNSSCYEKEFIVENDSIVYGIIFKTFDPSITLLSMETYDEKQCLKHYITLMPDNITGNHRHNIRTSEKYVYNKSNQLEKVMLVLEGYPSLSMLNEDEILYESSVE